MSRSVFVSGCDSNYFPLLLEWLHSFRRFKESEDFDICILDAGLEPSQIERLRPHVQAIVNPAWPVELPAYKIKGEYLKACVCRPFLPQIFPGYETYVWMDADTWVQDWRGVDLFLRGARSGKIALTAQVDRAYPRGGARIKWLGTLPWKVRGFYFSNALKAFGFPVAKALLPYHVLLAGMFALRGDSPHWARWQELVKGAMARGKVFTAEQLCLGKLCYLEGFAYEVLPAYAHWLCEFKPLWDAKNNAFVEPFLPREKLGVLHISGWDEMRLDRALTTNFDTTDGGAVQRSYRYALYEGALDKLLYIFLWRCRRPAVPGSRMRQPCDARLLEKIVEIILVMFCF
ncbi:MAG: hypothetical protein IT559_01335 [Alphaproteobacteria bacterium]|nr:hypothetical protein [Alphaproteobacteria bacterium]